MKLWLVLFDEMIPSAIMRILRTLKKLSNCSLPGRLRLILPPFFWHILMSEGHCVIPIRLLIYSDVSRWQQPKECCHCHQGGFIQRAYRQVLFLNIPVRSPLHYCRPPRMFREKNRTKDFDLSKLAQDQSIGDNPLCEKRCIYYLLLLCVEFLVIMTRNSFFIRIFA